MKTRILILAAVLLILIPFVNVAAQDQNIVEIAAGNPDFSTLVSLVEAAGLTDVLAGEGTYTVFAPTNEAFAELPAVVLEYLGAHPEELTRVLTYHVVGGAVMSADASTMMADSMEMASVGGDMMGSQLSITVSDAGVLVNDANVVTADVVASNGVIHAIDKVLIPAFVLPEVVPATLTGDIVSDGSSTVEPLAIAVANRFVEEGYSGNITIGESGTGGGFTAFCEEGVTDIANASRPIRTGEGEERDLCLAIERDPIEFRVGTDGLAVVVSSSNTFVEDVTTAELQAIFSTATNWSDVRADWPAEPILRYIPGTDSGTFDYFVEVVYDEDTAGILAAANLNQSENDNVLVQGVQASEFAVGFFGYAYYVQNADTLKIVGIDGVVPSTASVEDGSYSLARPLFIYSTAPIMQEKPQVAGFVNFFLTTVNEEIGTVGYFPSSEYTLNRGRLSYIAATGGM